MKNVLIFLFMLMTGMFMVSVIAFLNFNKSLKEMFDYFPSLTLYGCLYILNVIVFSSYYLYKKGSRM